MSTIRVVREEKALPEDPAGLPEARSPMVVRIFPAGMRAGFNFDKALDLVAEMDNERLLALSDSRLK
ncbi:MAG: hypothetical protein EXQ60_03255 [Candidatus Nanopelagicales bacterium]|nr:hypothetical protein [Candidatus Nanopelagicales bacterium]